jgi:CspA family cold shock protein
MAEGIVKWFDEKKGYGFITAPDGGADIFVHYSGIQGEGFKTLTEGEKVTYNMVVSEKGPKAENVVRVSPPTKLPSPQQTAAAQQIAAPLMPPPTGQGAAPPPA